MLDGKILVLKFFAVDALRVEKWGRNRQGLADTAANTAGATATDDDGDTMLFLPLFTLVADVNL